MVRTNFKVLQELNSTRSVVGLGLTFKAVPSFVKWPSNISDTYICVKVYAWLLRLSLRLLSALRVVKKILRYGVVKGLFLHSNALAAFIRVANFSRVPLSLSPDAELRKFCRK